MERLFRNFQPSSSSRKIVDQICFPEKIFCRKQSLGAPEKYCSSFEKLFLYRGGSRIFFRRGCSRLLLYSNTNKPHSFLCVCRTPVVLEKRRSSQEGGGGTHPLHPPPRSAPVLRCFAGEISFALGRRNGCIKVASRGLSLS